ncbi:MAG: flagellar protein [Rhizobiales bacterium]|nr:flagellar protein [Hyphomicrobiales bacterium]
MSGIVLSASVRQNLLSLQSTADLLSTTQNRLATGNKVNSALDNPTNFFTAQGLNNRASDINNLLDSIGNGVQVLQAANTGITSIQKLVDTAKSIANQALQTPSGYSKSTATSAALASNATADNLLGADTAAKVVGTSVTNLATASDVSTAAGGGFANGDTLIVNGKTITFSSAAGATTATTTDAVTGNVTVNMDYNDGTAKKATTTDLMSSIAGAIGGGATAAIATNVVTITAGNNNDSITLGGTALSKLGLTAGSKSATSTHAGEAITIGSVDGSAAQTITFGTAAGQVNTLADLNTKLAASNLTASLGTDGKLTFATTNDHASFDLSKTPSVFSGTATTGFLGSLTAAGPSPDNNSLATRASLVAQYNQVIDQIKTTAQDASFNGVNLLNGDQLKLVFNETGKSTLTIQGVTFDPAGLGLKSLASGTDFLDNANTNKVLDSLNSASSTLRSQASTFGSNLSIVQIRQDFNKNLINVLQTGASNLTLADTNEEAANSQALSTRQSIAVSALALANQSNQSVLQLLR